MNINNYNNNTTNTQNISDIPFKIATHNVRGMNNFSKQQQIIETLHLNKIDILGLSETKLKKNLNKHIYKNQKK